MAGDDVTASSADVVDRIFSFDDSLSRSSKRLFTDDDVAAMIAEDSGNKGTLFPSNNQIRGYSRPIIYWGVYDIPVLTIWAHSLSFLISCSRMFAYNNNFLSPSLWYTRLFIVSIIKG